jgi:hypothetical protein
LNCHVPTIAEAAENVTVKLEPETDVPVMRAPSKLPSLPVPVNTTGPAGTTDKVPLKVTLSGAPVTVPVIANVCRCVKVAVGLPKRLDVEMLDGEK